MEASSTVQMCLRRAFVRPGRCRHLLSSTKSISQSTTRSSTRTFTSTSHNRQDASPQPQSASQEKSIGGTVGRNPRPRLQDRPIPQADPNKRIDLSSLPGIPDSYIPPGGRKPNADTANAKLDALFYRPRIANENPFDKALRQTDEQNNTKGPIDLHALLQDLTMKNSKSDLDAEAKLALRLKPTLGRTQTLDVNRGIDLTRAFRMLEIKCSTNSVRRDEIKQRFHVRRGQRRKLERSLRWRKAFKEGFLEECARIRRMKNQGW